jgi:hypothetical protein
LRRQWLWRRRRDGNGGGGDGDGDGDDGDGDDDGYGVGTTGAGAHSYLPPGLTRSRHVGVGLSQSEMDANGALLEAPVEQVSLLCEVVQGTTNKACFFNSAKQEQGTRCGRIKRGWRQPWRRSGRGVANNGLSFLLSCPVPTLRCNSITTPESLQNQQQSSQHERESATLR